MIMSDIVQGFMSRNYKKNMGSTTKFLFLRKEKNMHISANFFLDCYKNEIFSNLKIFCEPTINGDVLKESLD